MMGRNFDEWRSSFTSPDAAAQSAFREAERLRAQLAAAVMDPLDWPLPCDVSVGGWLAPKGTKLRTLVARMNWLHKRREAKQIAPALDYDHADAFAQQLIADGWHNADLDCVDRLLRSLTHFLPLVQQPHGDAGFYHGTINALALLKVHGYGIHSTYARDLIATVSEKRLYQVAEDEDYEWAGLDRSKKPSAPEASSPRSEHECHATK